MLEHTDQPLNCLLPLSYNDYFCVCGFHSWGCRALTPDIFSLFSGGIFFASIFLAICDNLLNIKKIFCFYWTFVYSQLYFCKQLQSKIKKLKVFILQWVTVFFPLKLCGRTHIYKCHLWAAECHFAEIIKSLGKGMKYRNIFK